MDERFVEAVLQAVESIPPGRVATYGDIADAVGRGGPRQVGTVMAQYGATVSWWRVLRADGRPAAGIEAQALSHLRAECTPMAGDRVDLAKARFAPPTFQATDKTQTAKTPPGSNPGADVQG
jgi:alkylated DNA nucleotide flippase Atl1